MTLLPAAPLIGAFPMGWLGAREARRWADSTLPPMWLMIVIELAVAASVVLLTPQRDWPFLLLAGWVLAVLAVVDVLAFRLPDGLTLPLGIAGLIMGPKLSGAPWTDHLIGAAAGFAVLAGIAWVYARVRGREGLGLGDAKLLGVAGAWLGWMALPNLVIIACAGGLAWAAFRLLRRGQAALSEPIAFGLPLCVALWVLLIMETSEFLPRAFS